MGVKAAEDFCVIDLMLHILLDGKEAACLVENYELNATDAAKKCTKSL